MVDPMNAHRKAQKAKDRKKHKGERKDAKTIKLAKSNTQDLEEEIEELEAKQDKDATTKLRIEIAKKELAKIMKIKENYVLAHPEERHFVYHKRIPKVTAQVDVPVAPKLRDEKLLFDKKGKLLNPERSAFYDPVYNPFGVPPPGMPYMQKEGLSSSESEDSDDEPDSDGIVMPAGPPPKAQSSDSDDDFELPPGPPPGSVPSQQQVEPHAAIQPTIYRPPVISAPPSIISAGPSIISAAPSIISAGPSSLPPKPSLTTAAPSISAQPTLSQPSVISTASTISAAPQIRDLVKEATSFMPTAVKRKKAPTAASAGPTKVAAINAAPGIASDGPQRQSLVGSVQGALGPSNENNGGYNDLEDFDA